MRSHQTKRAMFLAIALLTFGAACETTLAASATESADARPIDGGSLTFDIQTPAGGTSRLTYVDTDGWRIDERDAPLKPMEGRITPASAESQKEASAGERPMTVFIDGPTGFTYVWTRDQGWKYVGRISDRKR